MSILLKVDTREKSHKNEKQSKKVIMYLEKYSQDLLEKRNIKVNIVREELQIGDYQICDPNTKYPFVIIERKKWNDLSSSISDNRFKYQKHNMRRESSIKGSKILYLIEGPRITKNGKNIGVHSRARLIGVVRRLTLMGIPCLYSSNLEQSTEILIDCVKDVAGKLNKKMKIYGSVDQLVIDKIKILTNTPGLSNDLKLSLNDLVTNTDVQNPTYNESYFQEVYKSEDFEIKRKVIDIWTSLDKVSNKIAELLIKKISVYDFIFKPELLYGLDLVYISGRRVSTKTIDAIIENLNNKNKQIELLSKVPQISKAKAEAILKDRDVKDIFNVDTSVCEEITTIQCGKRRIGNAACKKIETYFNWKYTN